MFNRKREISAIEKTEIVLEYLNEELTHLCGITTPTDQDHVSRSISHIQNQILFQAKKLNYLRAASK
jgi:hypothetical protein